MVAQVRLHSPDCDPEVDGQGVPTAAARLRTLYERGFIPLYAAPRQLSQRTLDAIERTLKHWEHLTVDPPLHAIDRLVVSNFQTALGKQRGNKPGSKMAVGTVRLHAGNLDQLLKFAGPPDRSDTGCLSLGLIAQPPPVIKPRPDSEAPDGDWSIEEVRTMWVATKHMRCCKLRALGIPPAQWWCALIAVASYTGLRRGQLLGLAYEDLDPPFIRVRSGRSKGRRGRKQYLPPLALELIEAIRTPRERIFPWPYHLRWLDAQLAYLVKLAGVRAFGWNGFRKLALTGAFEIGGREGAQAVGGHTNSSTTMRHYVNGTAQALKAAAVIDQMPSPKPHPDDSRQQRLF